VDSQYGGKFKTSGLVKRLQELIDEIHPEFVVGPLGLVHSDHEVVRDAVLDATSAAARPVWLYEDLPYRVAAPEAIPAALDALRGRGYELELGFIGTGPIDKKMDALWCYRSQMGLPEFENRHELLVAERSWRITKAVTLEEHV
jgi:LmbE family N-acetylglucosaminyl deacetylase